MFIYKIYHPSSDKVYIGKAKDVRKRLTGHLQDSKKSKSRIHRWLMKLRRGGLYPKTAIVEKVYPSNWESRERHWIKYYREKLGEDFVLNIRDGGEDPPQGHRLGKTVAADARLRMSLAQKKRFKSNPGPNSGKTFSKEYREKLSRAHIGQVAWNKGKQFNKEQLDSYRSKRNKFKNQKDINTIYEMYWIDCKSMKFIIDIYKSHSITIGKIVRQTGGFKYTGNKEIKRTKIHASMKL